MNIHREEYVMKTLATLIGTMAPATAMAAANTPAGNDGIFIWIFLGFFATIIVGQLVPAAMLIVGLVKGITAKNEAKAEAR
jgi:hypothetical protein